MFCLLCSAVFGIVYKMCKQRFALYKMFNCRMFFLLQNVQLYNIFPFLVSDFLCVHNTLIFTTSLPCMRHSRKLVSVGSYTTGTLLEKSNITCLIYVAWLTQVCFTWVCKGMGEHNAHVNPLLRYTTIYSLVYIHDLSTYTCILWDKNYSVHAKNCSIYYRNKQREDDSLQQGQTQWNVQTLFRSNL